MKMNVQTMTLVAVMTAVMCILGPMSIPIGPVPVSLTVLTVYLAVYILGMRYGTMAYIIYLLIGLVGAPVLSGYSGGPAKVFGPTGGYLISFILMALISGWFIDHYYKKIPMQVLGMVLGLIVCYIFGTTWLAVLAHMDAKAALAAGVIPFIPFDLIKIAISVIVGRAVRNRLSRMLPGCSVAA